MIKKYFLFAFTTAIFLIVSCEDSTLDPGGDKPKKDSTKYVFYTKVLLGGYSEIRRINLGNRKDELFKDNARAVKIIENKLYYMTTDSLPYMLRCFDIKTAKDSLLRRWQNLIAYFPVIYLDGSRVIYYHYLSPEGILALYESSINGENESKVYSYKTELSKIKFACFHYFSSSIILAVPFIKSNLSYVNFIKVQESNLLSDTLNRFDLMGYAELSGSFSPYGDCIAFLRIDTAGSKIKTDIALFSISNQNIRIITNDGNYKSRFAWSPKGDKLAFYRNGGSFSIIDSAGKSENKITNTVGGDNLVGFYPCWSDDGERLLFQVNTTVSESILLGSLKMLDLQTMKLETLVNEEWVYNAFFN